MEELPEALLTEIFKRINRTVDRNSISLVCKHLSKVEAEQRAALSVGCGLHPATQALETLCRRFRNLKKVEIAYSGWISNLGKQLDNQGLFVLSTNCPSLTELTLSFCSFINDAGLSHLSSCQNLKILKLNFAPAISSNGILSLVVGCKNLSAIHLIRCMKVSSVEWLEYLGKQGNLEDLVIKNCRAIGEDDLLKLGPGWKNLKRLEFEVDAYYRYPKVYDCSSLAKWQLLQVLCEELRELSLVNCVISPGRGLSCLLGKCPALECLKLDMCIGIKDGDIVALSRSSTRLRSVSVRLPSQFLAPVLLNIPLNLTDESLKALAAGCAAIETVELTFSDREFPSVSGFTQSGILSLVSGCRIRSLSLNCACFFSDFGMRELMSAPFLETLSLVKCQEITDDGIKLVVGFPCLKMLRLVKCLGVTDDGLKPLLGSNKLESLVVEDCPQVSERGVVGAAKTVSYKQDLSWLY